MPYTLIYPDSYIRRAEKFLRKHPEIQNQYRKTLELLELDPYHPSLRLHSLEGRLKGLSFVSINMSYRIVLELEIQDEEIILINIGNHDQVYWNERDVSHCFCNTVSNMWISEILLFMFMNAFTIRFVIISAKCHSGPTRANKH